MNIQPIRSAEDHKKALKEIERLWNAEPNTPAYDRLDVLATLVDAYEREHTPVGPPEPVQAILFALEQRGLTQSQLATFLGSRSRASEVLSHKRPLTLPMIRKLNQELRVPLEVLVAESKKAPSGTRTKVAKKSVGRTSRHSKSK